MSVDEGNLTDKDNFCHVFRLVLVSETGSQSIAQASLELMGNPLVGQPSVGITGFGYHAQCIYVCF